MPRMINASWQVTACPTSIGKPNTTGLTVSIRKIHDLESCSAMIAFTTVILIECIFAWSANSMLMVISWRSVPPSAGVGASAMIDCFISASSSFSGDGNLAGGNSNSFSGGRDCLP